MNDLIRQEYAWCNIVERKIKNKYFYYFYIILLAGPIKN